MIEQLEEQFTKYEIARILGARALQIAMDAPLLLKLQTEELEQINYNPIDIAKKELISGVLPITVNRPLPRKKEATIRKLSKEEVEALKKEEKMKKEEQPVKEKEGKEGEKVEKEVEEVVEEKAEPDAEMMELANPDDEAEESSETPEEEGI